MTLNQPTPRKRPLSAPVIHQLLHGYDNGHRLLAASDSIAPELLRVIDRLSDATGSSSHPDNDGYLTGYPLPAARYALARTWPAWEIPRPNCVWTHTLIFHGEHLATATDLLVWTSLFVRPKPHGHEAYQRAILPREVITSSAAGASGVPLVAGDLEPVERLCHGLYSRDEGLAWLEVADRKEREEVALAIWAQQWPALRRRFSFCTGALEPRRVGNRPFDLCLVPRGAAAAFLSALAPPGPPDVDVRWLAADLARPSAAFRDFVTFVAGGSARRSMMLSLARTWRVLHEPTDVPTLFRTIEAELKQLGPRQEHGRRVKRTLFRLPKAAIAPLASPSVVLEALTGPSFAAAVAPEDATIQGWAEKAWQDDPATVLSLYKDPARSSFKFELGNAIVNAAAPTDLAVIARAAPDLAGLLLSHRGNRAWWSAWASLGLPDMVASTASAPQGWFGEATARLACDALVESSTVDAIRAWEHLATLDGALAVRSVVRSLAAHPQQEPRWRSALNSRVAELVDLLSSGPPAEHLRVLAEALEPQPQILHLGLRPWTPLDSRAALSALRRGGALLFLAGLADPDGATLPFFARLYALVYTRLANTPASEEWSVLSRRLAGSEGDWDRCRRLAKTAAKKTHISGPNEARLITEVERVDRIAALHLRAEVEARAHGKRKILGFEPPW